MTSKQKKAQCLRSIRAKAALVPHKTPKTFVFTLSFLPSEEETSTVSQIQHAVATYDET